jgi:hypothetical protein
MPIGIYNSKTYDMFEMIDSTNPHNLYDIWPALLVLDKVYS